ncbi:YeaH/YhbH family protein [Methylohalobius crimeensis]|uniref:YeaH/YhbH family protein n=1 Tax=Methylohalobius crimeensis TaxID=244365 RepID=UPI0003B36D91|nr:YeaH/YhbH family protein [Methylohalobius crimeensis]
MSQIIDRRLNPKHKSAVNRQRFLHRFRKQIRKAVADAVDGRSVTDTESGERITIPAKDLSEPTFHHGPGGRREGVHPGNKEFITGDRIPRPQGGEGRGNRASNQGEGMDDFVFELSRDEFLEFFFEDLELPDLIKTKLAQEVSQRSIPAGFSKDGIPPNLHVIRSLKEAHARRIALTTAKRRRLRELEAELESLQAAGAGENELIELRREIEHLKAKIAAVPFLDTLDLRYRNRIQVPKPTTQAVMFCLMDVSGSMDQYKKSLAKRFFLLLYLFLSRNYERTDVVFIRHHTVAKEVDEEEFFYSRETGGTVVSSALELLREIMRERYPSQDWNLYAAQASDGDNWPEDSGNCGHLLDAEILPYLQYYAYIEIDNEYPLGLWQEYEKIARRWPNFAMQAIDEPADIYPVFRELFKKKGVKG